MRSIVRFALVVGFIWVSGVARAQPPSEGPTLTALNSMRIGFNQVAITPTHMAKADAAGLRAVVAEARQHVITLAAAFDAAEAPDPYVEDLTGIALRLAQLASKSSFALEDLVVLREIEKDLRAKRRWAEQHPATPGGEAVLEVSSAGVPREGIRTTKLVGAAGARERIFLVGDEGLVRLPLLPGLYHVAAAVGDARPAECIVDGSQPRLRLP